MYKMCNKINRHIDFMFYNTKYYIGYNKLKVKKTHQTLFRPTSNRNQTKGKIDKFVQTRITHYFSLQRSSKPKIVTADKEKLNDNDPEFFRV